MAPFPAISRASLDLLSSAEQLAERAVIEPTKTLITDAILRRQQTTAPTATVTVVSGGGSGSGSSSSSNGPDNAQTLSGGAIAGIVIGSIVGLLLLIWIFRSCSNMGAPPVKGENPSGRAWYDNVQASSGNRYPVERHSHSHSRHRSHSRHSHRRPSADVYGSVPVMTQPQPTYVYQSDTRDIRRGRSRDGHRSRSRSRY